MCQDVSGKWLWNARGHAIDTPARREGCAIFTRPSCRFCVRRINDERVCHRWRRRGPPWIFAPCAQRDSHRHPWRMLPPTYARLGVACWPPAPSHRPVPKTLLQAVAPVVCRHMNLGRSERSDVLRPQQPRCSPRTASKRCPRRPSTRCGVCGRSTHAALIYHPAIRSQRRVEPAGDGPRA